MATAKKLPSGSYRVRIYDKRINGTKSFTASTKKEAERLAAEYLNTALPGEILTFREAAEQYIDIKSSTLSPTTIAGYKTILNNSTGRINDKPLDDITIQIIQDLINDLSSKLSPKTVRNCFGFITAVLTYNDVLINTKKLSLPKKARKFKRLPTPEEVIGAVRGTDIELPVLMGMWLGMRISEILGARKSDIDGNILTINQVIVTVDKKEVVKQTAKTYNSNRQLRLPEYILDLIDNVDGDRLVPETRSSVYHKFKRKMNTIGYDISFHDLRHVNASVMAFLDIPDIYAMERGGWSNTSTLKGVYQQTFDSERISVDNKIDNYFATKLATENIGQRKIEA